jgi:hypothetical protein
VTAFPTARIIDAATRGPGSTRTRPGFSTCVRRPSSRPPTSQAPTTSRSTCSGMALAKMPWNHPAAGIDVDAVLRALGKDA